MNRDDPDDAGQAINSLLADDRYDAARPSIEAARSLVLDKYNAFAAIANYVKEFPERPCRDVLLKPESSILAWRNVPCKTFFAKTNARRFRKAKVRSGPGVG